MRTLIVLTLWLGIIAIALVKCGGTEVSGYDDGYMDGFASGYHQKCGGGDVIADGTCESMGYSDGYRDGITEGRIFGKTGCDSH